MNKKGHWIFAFLLGFSIVIGSYVLGLNWFAFDFISFLIIIGILAFYSLLPDIDHPAGTMTWIFLGIGIFGVIFGILQLIFGFGRALTTLITSSFLLVLTFYSAHMLPHRGIIHTIQIGILSVIPLWFLFSNLAYCLLAYVAWHSHLAGDGYIFKIK